MFFSVKTSVKILDKTYIPCVCYAMNETIQKTIEDLANKNKAVIYDEKVFFQNGKVIKTQKMLKAEKKEARKEAKKAEKLAEKTEVFDDKDQIEMDF